MYRIALINMPFANLQMPSIALTQLKSVVEDRFKNEVAVDVHYFNHDFANYLGLELYDHITRSAESQNSGLGDWFFRQIAFPDQANNMAVYITRYFPYHTPQITALKNVVMEKRRGLDRFMDGLIAKYALDRTQLVGFTSMFMQNAAAFALARKLKTRDAKITVVRSFACVSRTTGRSVVMKTSSPAGCSTKTAGRFGDGRLDCWS